MASTVNFFVKTHHSNYGAKTRVFATRDEAYAHYCTMIADQWSVCVTLWFAPGGFILNQWRRPVAE